MKRIAILVVLLLVAGLAGIVRSHSRSGSMGEITGLVSHNAEGQTRDEIRRSYELAPGATVDVSGINGSVTVETSDSKTAEVYVERIGPSQESLSRRKINIDADANGLRISSERGDVGFFARLFGSNPTENVSLKVPRQISLRTKGVNGFVSVGEVDGSVDVRGVNGRVQIASASGTADFKGINGNIKVGLKRLDRDGVSINGINGNIELQVNDGVNADLDAHGMNGRVVSEIAGVTVEQTGRHGNYSAHIGAGGSAISVKGINGNVRLTRGATAADNRKESSGN